MSNFECLLPRILSGGRGLGAVPQGTTTNSLNRRIAVVQTSELRATKRTLLEIDKSSSRAIAAVAEIASVLAENEIH
jgi:phosphoribosylformylglycinamidine (FGAM) synthase PurS component